MEPSDRDPGPEDLARYHILRATRLHADETAGMTRFDSALATVFKSINNIACRQMCPATIKQSL